MTEDEREREILRRYVARYEEAERTTPGSKCARELDMREVLRALEPLDDPSLTLGAERWLLKLAPRRTAKVWGPLKRCSLRDLQTGPHRYNARAFVDPGCTPPDPAWVQLAELERRLSIVTARSPEKELEQAFGILYSRKQASSDFDAMRRCGKEPVWVMFADIDHFKALNTRFTHPVVDKHILTPFQHLLRALASGQGEVYRYGGEEFLLILPSLDEEQVAAVAERVRACVGSHPFEVEGEPVTMTVSIGVASVPVNGTSLDDVTTAASGAQARAKESGRNTVLFAGSRPGETRPGVGAS